MIKACRFKLEPNRKQKYALARTLDVCRELYNDCLYQRKLHRTNRFDPSAELTELKAAFPVYKNVFFASSNRQNVRICRAFWSSADVQRNGFFATAYYASPCALWTQACFSKSSCATRLKVSAATALQARSCHTPCAVGATPAAEVVAVDPDQVFVHTSAFARVLGLELGLRWVGHQASESPHHHG